MDRIAVVAVGGNSLIKDKTRQAVSEQHAAARETSVHVAEMFEQGWKVAITHGNGPQVGHAQRRSELARHEVHEEPLHCSVASTQGYIGYMLQQSLSNEFRKRKLDRQTATVVTQVLVDRNDPAFRNPTKPIGSFMGKEEALRRRDTEGWDVVDDAGRGWRRVVPSPLPLRVVEQDIVKKLIEAGFVVITVGGGGIPVIEDKDGNLKSVAAVIDKDYASSLLATSIGADLLLISTDVGKTALDFGKPNQRWIDRMNVAEAKRHMAAGHFAAGSMKPKIEASVWFLEKGGDEAIITDPRSIARALVGEAGTHIIP